MIADPMTLQFETEESVEANHRSVQTSHQSADTNHQIVDDYIYLIGRPTLRDFLSFVKNRAPNGHRHNVGALVDEWRRGAKHICELDKTENDCVSPAIQPLPVELDAVRKQFERHPLVEHGFNTVPTQLGMVELDRL